MVVIPGCIYEIAANKISKISKSQSIDSSRRKLKRLSQVCCCRGSVVCFNICVHHPWKPPFISGYLVKVNLFLSVYLWNTILYKRAVSLKHRLVFVRNILVSHFSCDLDVRTVFWVSRQRWETYFFSTQFSRSTLKCHVDTSARVGSALTLTTSGNLSTHYCIACHKRKLGKQKSPRLVTSHVTRKPVLGVCDQVRLKPACTADETSS